jgi:S1-C subfamily serine protease
MSKLWYVREVPSAEPVGPFTLSDLRREVQAGRFREALVATDGATAWRPLLSELADEDPVGNAPTAVHAAAAAPLSLAGAAAASVSPSVHGQPSAPAFGPVNAAVSSAGMRVTPRVPSHPPAARISNAALLVLATVGALFTALVVFGVVVFVRKHGQGGAGGVASGVVRVELPDGSGTGFFVTGPDDLAYVATAYHVIASGEPILIEQSLEGTGGRRYTQAYPGAEVVAFDADADVAIIRLDGVGADHFHPLRLAAEAKADESLLSYGFPASSLAHKFGMVSKPGKVLSLVRFPVVDHRTGEVVRSDAVSGLLVSVDIEPGFSGGPTVNDKGEVVGVNVTKDLAHRGQNGAVEVSVLRELLTHVKRADAQRDPTADEVKALLTRVEHEYLLLPIDRRKAAREDNLVSASDLPRVGELITTIRRLEIDTSRKADNKLSGAAGLGLILARLPGRPLETYRDRSTQKAMADCEVRERGLREFFGSIASSKGTPAPNPAAAAEEARAKCSELAFRPLVWDLTALAMQWEGAPRDITVSKVETVDPDRHVYRAAVQFAGIDHLVDVWLGADGGRLRLKLFDSNGEASGLATGRQVQGSAFAGTWHRSEPRIAHNVARGLDSDMETDETVAVVMGSDGTANITHQFRRKLYFTGARRLACGGNVLSLGMEQSFSGNLEGGTITAARSKDPRGTTADTSKCPEALAYSPDLVVVLKMAADKLLVYRTGGAEYPEVVEFTREL